MSRAGWMKLGVKPSKQDAKAETFLYYYIFHLVVRHITILVKENSPIFIIF
jgi:hypothetical protein